MYKVEYDDGLFWITKDGKPLKELGGYIDPITPQIILEELDGEI